MKHDGSEASEPTQAQLKKRESITQEWLEKFEKARVELDADNDMSPVMKKLAVDSVDAMIDDLSEELDWLRSKLEQR